MMKGLRKLFFKNGILKMKLNKFDEAEKNFKRALELDNQFNDAYFNLGKLYMQKKRINWLNKCF